MTGRSKNYTCPEDGIEKELVEKVKRAMLNDEIYEKLADIFKIMGDKTRTKILFALSEADLCVCDIATVINMSVSSVSHHLRYLRALELVKFKKKGKMVYYSIVDQHISRFLKLAAEHLSVSSFVSK
ncbi:MAG TPA: transcriptional regulator [Thermoplasmata archaeon]|nr:transcriptional regulator [Thermoplasmata archaeon]